MVCCVVTLGFGAGAAPAQVSGERALAELNGWRAELRLPAVRRLDPVMSAACRLHNRYMALNPSLAPTHDESPANAGWSAAGEAAGAASLFASVTEAATPRELWEFAVFHRVALLDPRLRTTWWSFNDGWACMGSELVDDTATAPTVVAYPSPADGASGVPTGFSDLEVPDPRDFVPGRPSRIGWPLSVSFNGPWGSEPDLTLTGATLVTAAGEAVDVTGLDSRIQRWHSAVAVLPHAPLRPSTGYIARVSGFATAGSRTHPFDVTWRFTTAGASPADEVLAAPPERRLTVRLRTRLSRGRVAVTLTVPRVAAGRRATLSVQRPSGGTYTSRRLVLAPTTRTTLRVPVRGPLRLRLRIPRFASGAEVWGDVTLSRIIRRR
jgi:hypothetical protein